MALKYICGGCKNAFGIGNFNKVKGMCFTCARYDEQKRDRQGELNHLAEDLVSGKSGEKKQTVDGADIKK